MPEVSVLAKLLEPVLEIARHQRIAPQQLLSEVGLSLEAISQPAARIPGTAHNRLLQILAERLNNPQIALRIGEATQPRMLGSVGFLMTTAQDLNASFQQLADYLPILLQGAHLDYRDNPSGRILRLELSQSLPFTEEWLLACLYNWPRWLSGKQIPALSVSLLQPEPAQAQPYQQFFAAEISFDAPANQIILPARYLEYPCLDSNDEMNQLHREFADSLLSHSSEESALIARIRSQIRLQLARGDGQVRREEIAALLNMSLRTMQRKLSSLNSSFQQLLDQTRKEASLQEIRKGKLSFGEISFRMGFSNLSAFQKAFKRWQGVPPTQYRRQLNQQSEAVQPVDKEQSLERLPACSLPEFYPLALQLVTNSHQWPGEAVIVPAMLMLSRHQEQYKLRLQEGADYPQDEHYRYQAPELDSIPLQAPHSRNTTRLYNLGALLWRLLTGSAPFTQADLPSLIQARRDGEPAGLPDYLPDHLHILLRKLLMQQPAQRYNSLDALTGDLMRSYKLWQQKLDPSAYPVVPDPPGQLSLDSARIWQPQIDSFKSAIRELRGFSHWQLNAPAGSGKTSFLAQLQQQLKAEATILYADLAAENSEGMLRLLFRPLLCQIINSDNAQKKQWQQRLLQQLSRGTGLDSILPELSALLPDTADRHPAATMQPESEAWLELARQLMMSCNHQPLLIMLDNSEQLSPFGQSLLHSLHNRPLPLPLLLLTSSAQPLLQAQRQIALPHPLTPAQIHQLIAPACDQPAALATLLSQQESHSLAAIRQQLDQLQQQQALTYHQEDQRWHFTHTSDEHSSPSPLGELYQDNIDQLHVISRQLLDIAAVIGHRFSLQQLARLRQDQLARIEIHIWPLLQANILIRPDNNSQLFQFSHPDLARFIYHQIETTALQELHLKIGQDLYQQEADNGEPQPYLAHMASCVALLSSQARLQYASSCAEKAYQSDQSLRYHQALAFTDQGLKLLGDLSSPLQFQLGLRRCRLLGILGQDREADSLYRSLRQKHRDAEAQQQLVQLKAKQLVKSGQLVRAEKLLNRALEFQGTPIPSDQTALRLQLADQWGRVLSGQTAAPLNRYQKAMLEQYSQVCEQLGLPLQQACAISRQPLAGLEPVPEDAITLAGLGFVSSWLSEDIAAARHFSQQAQQQVATLTDGEAKARTLLICGSRINHWYQSLEQAQTLSQQAEKIALRCRDWPLAGQAVMINCLNALWGDQSLPSPEALRRGPFETLSQIQQPHQAETLRRSALWLTEQLSTSTEPDTWESNRHESRNSWHMLARSCAALLLERRSEWDRCLKHEALLENQLAGHFAIVPMQLFTALMRLDRLRHPQSRHHPVLWREISRQTARFEYWANHNPASYSAYWQLLEAEISSLKGQAEKARNDYEQALSDCHSLMLRAMILERYGRHCQQEQQTTVATLLLQQAAHSYRNWGAEAKARQLEQGLSDTTPTAGKIPPAQHSVYNSRLASLTDD